MPQPIRLKDHEKDARLVKRRVLVGGVVIILLTRSPERTSEETTWTT